MTAINKKQPGRILYVSGKAGFFGGVERYIYDTAEALADAGWNVSMMFAETALEADKFLKRFKKKFRFSDIDSLLAREDFDLVIIFKVDDVGLVARLRLAFTTCVCVSDHDYYCLRRHKYFPAGRINCTLPSNIFYCSLCSLGRGKPFKYAALFNEIRKCDSFIVISDFMRDNLLLNGFSPDKIYRILPLCKLPGKLKCRKAFASPPRLMYAGQLVRGKGVDLLLLALAGIGRSYKCLIVGDGNDRRFLERLTFRLELDGKVEFTGWRNDMATFWNRADIAVFPSRWQEPFGLTGIEAMTHKIPVIGFDVGGVREWLHHNENGLLVPPKNVMALRAAIEDLLKAPRRAAAMGAAGARFAAENFTAAKFVSAVTGMLKDIKKKPKA